MWLNSDNPPTPPQVPDYQLLRRIGHGGYGDVWLAKSVLGTYRAIKVVYRDRFQESRPYEREFVGIRRFEPVSRAHPSQIAILHVGRPEGANLFYYVMELADDLERGPDIVPDDYQPKTLACLLDRRGRLPYEECLATIVGLCEALAELHLRRLIHRDIKPSNIVYVDGVPKLADIGLVAELDETISMVGTSGYLPPEGPGSISGDIYGLGKVLYEMVTGHDRNEFPALPKNLAQFADRKQLLELNEIICRACAKAPKDRYESVDALLGDLRLLKQGGSLKRRLAIRHQLRIGRWIAAGAAAAFFLFVGLEEARESYVSTKLAQSESRRLKGELGQQVLGLKTVKQLSSLYRRPPVRLRNEAIACLVRPDAELRSESLAISENALSVAFDPHSPAYGYLAANGNIEMRSMASEIGESISLVAATNSVTEGALVLKPGGDYVGLRGGDEISACRVWALQGTPREVGQYPDCRAFAFANTREELAILSSEHWLSLRRLPNGEQGKEVYVNLPPHTNFQPNHVQFSADDRLIAVVETNSFNLVVVDWKSLKTYHYDPPYGPLSDITSLSWHPDRPELALGCSNGGVYTWRIRRNEISEAIKHPKGPVLVRHVPATGDLVSMGADRQLRLWSGNEPTRTEMTFSLPSRSQSLAVLDGRKLVLESRDQGVAIMAELIANEITTTRYDRLASGAKVIDLSMSGDERWVAALSEGGVSFWQPNSLLPEKAEIAGRYSVARFKPGSTRLVLASEHRPHWLDARPAPGLWSRNTHLGPAVTTELPERPRSLAVDEEGNLLVGYTDSIRTARDTTSSQQVAPFRGDVVAISVDGEWMAAVDQSGGVLRIWDAARAQPVTEMRVEWPVTLSFHPQNEFLAVGEVAGNRFLRGPVGGNS